MGKIIFFGGKGGVGKTSCSSAYSLAKAKCGKRVLLVSTDPAHSISDLFNKKIGNQIVELEDNLYGLEIDPEKESETYIDGIRKNLKKIYSPIIMEELTKQLDAAKVSPGSHESALFDKMVEIINEMSKDYDYIVFDTAPTGHTIRLLSLPELLGSWIDSLLAKRRKTLKLRLMAKLDDQKDDPVLEILNRRKTNLERARETMISSGNLGFIFVLNAERLPIEETKKAIDLLKKYNIPIDRLVVNRILPDNNTDEFWKNKKVQETQYLDLIENTFKDYWIGKVPMFPYDMDEDTLDFMSKYF